MKTITTKYVGPSNTKGGRIIASDGDGNRIVKGYDHRLNSEGNHEEACLALMRKMRWCGSVSGGHLLKAGRTVGMAWVDTHSDYMVVLHKGGTT